MESIEQVPINNIKLKKSSQKSTPFLIEFIAGWMGGVGQILTAQPFDIIKIRLQTQNSSAEIGSKTYSGAFECFRRIVSEEGILSLYKGSLSPLLGVGTMSAIQFYSY